MSEPGSANANRIELESQILCSALRLSRVIEDVEGMVKSAGELYQIFPDLLPQPKSNGKKPEDLYQLFALSYEVYQSSVIASYFRAAKYFLREQNVKENQGEYWRILNAAFILRKPRLRLSHDLIVVRDWLTANHLISEDGAIEAHAIEKIRQAKAERPLEEKLPMLIELLKYSNIIGPAEVQALLNQMQIAPEIPLVELILNAGYVTDTEMKSLQLAEYLLNQGKITLPQFAVAMYDERTQGIRMAESLQVRGWLATEAGTYSEGAKK